MKALLNGHEEEIDQPTLHIREESQPDVADELNGARWKGENLIVDSVLRKNPFTGA